MLKFLHQLSAVTFYLLGLNFFVAYVLLHNEIGGVGPAVWMQTADLPLAFSALVYGGTSFYLSVKPKNRSSPALAWTVGILLGALFLFFVVLNFWGVLAA